MATNGTTRILFRSIIGPWQSPSTFPMNLQPTYMDDPASTFPMIFTACCIAVTLAGIIILELLINPHDSGKVYAPREVLDLNGGNNILCVWIILIITLAAIQALPSPLNQHIEEEQVIMRSIMIKEMKTSNFYIFLESNQHIDETRVQSSIEINENMMPALSSHHLQPISQQVDGNSVVTSTSTAIKRNMMRTPFSHLQPWVYYQFIVFCMYAFSGSVSAVLLHNKPKMDKFFRFCQFYSQVSMASAGFILFYAALSGTFPSVLFTMLTSPVLIILLPVVFLWSAFKIKHRSALRSKLNSTFKSSLNALKVISI